MTVRNLLTAPIHRPLRLSIIFFLLPYLYSHFCQQNAGNLHSVEQAMFQAWEREMVKQGGFRRVVVGFNCNVDIVVSGVQVVESLNTTCSEPKNHEVIQSLTDLHETFVYFFQKGATSEKYLADEMAFTTTIRQAEQTGRARHYLGGNAAIMAERIAAAFPSTEVVLVGPIGPRSQALIHPAVQQTNSTKIVKDEMHVILEYKQGEILSEWVAPSSSRFIVTRDQFSGSAMVIEMFFKAIAQYRPDLVILSGVHHLEFQDKESRNEKLGIIRRNLLQIDSKVPIHLELGSLGDSSFIIDLVNKVIPYVDSLSISEQELSLLSHAAGGPYAKEYPVQPGTTHPHKVVEMLSWLLKTYGKGTKRNGYRLQRIHFHCLTYHIMVSSGSDWSNLAAAVAAGARLAGRLSCNINGENVDSDVLEVRIKKTLTLDKHVGRVYNFEPHNPMASWMREDVLFVFTPVLVCKIPSKTVGIDDAISVTGLLYSQFYRFGN